MAIEFNCPYCTATMRVPDAYAGQQGRCPKCDTKLLVPQIPRGGGTAPVVAASEVTRTSEPAPQPLPSMMPPGSSPEMIVADTTITRPRAGSYGSRRRQKYRLPTRVLMIGLPAVGFLVLLGAIFWSLTTGLNLSGDLNGRRLNGAALPSVTLPWTDVDLADADRNEVRQFLMKNPEVLSSKLVTCRLVGTEDGIEVRLTAGREGQWFVVDTTGNAPLALWLKNERAKLNPLRLKSMRDTLTAWAKDKLAQARGEPIAIDAAGVRDNIGFNANGGPLSFAAAAVVGEQLIPCAGEDKDGNLVFSLPKATTAFRVVGRDFPDGHKQFSGDYSVTVSGEVITLEEPESEAATDDGGEMKSDEVEEPTEKVEMKDEEPARADAAIDEEDKM